MSERLRIPYPSDTRGLEDLVDPKWCRKSPPLRNASYVIDGTTLEVFDGDNKPLEPLELSDGDVVALRLEGDDLVVIGDESVRAPATHSARNAGPNRYREILIEKK